MTDHKSSRYQKLILCSENSVFSVVFRVQAGRLFSLAMCFFVFFLQGGKMQQWESEVWFGYILPVSTNGLFYKHAKSAFRQKKKKGCEEFCVTLDFLTFKRNTIFQVGCKYWIINATVFKQFLNVMALGVYFSLLDYVLLALVNSLLTMGKLTGQSDSSTDLHCCRPQKQNRVGVLGH